MSGVTVYTEWDPDVAVVEQGRCVQQNFEDQHRDSGRTYRGHHREFDPR